MLGLNKGAMFAICVVVAAAAVGVLAYRAWQATVPAPIVAPATPAPAAEIAVQPRAEQAAPAAPQARQPAPPGFDVVRVEPTGDTVVAGRAAPNADVALLDRGKVIATTTADANGQFAFVPSPLPAGDHLLALEEKSRDGQVISAQTVAVVVPQPKGAGDVVAALTEPDQPTRLLSAPPRPAPATGTPQAAADTLAVAIRTVEMQEHGDFFATGSAPPGAAVRLYLNGSAVADLTAGQDGIWSLDLTNGMQPGSYVVRADQIDPASGKVVARAEVPFDYKAFVAAEGSAGPAVATDGSANTSAVAAISSVTVVQGDNLWRISRKVLGRGIRYTQIYAANTSQIRDPRLIYPGQVLVLSPPQAGVN
jgi:nucleoid-associated protein YgaU